MYVMLLLVDPPQVDVVNRQQTPNPEKNNIIENYEYKRENLNKLFNN